jgi:hypothetical protein
MVTINLIIDELFSDEEKLNGTEQRKGNPTGVDSHFSSERRTGAPHTDTLWLLLRKPFQEYPQERDIIAH